MPAPGHAYETTVWTDQQSLPTVRDIVTRMGTSIRVTGVGGPRRTSPQEWAASLGTASDDDLRRLVIAKPATYLLLATMTQVEPAAITAAMEQGTTILALEPIAADFRELERFKLFARPSADRPAIETPGRYVHCPAFTQSPGWLRAADPQLVLEAITGGAFLSATRLGEGSLFARLHEAFRLFLDFMPLPESIDCSLSTPLPAAPQSLREITGLLSAHARLPDDASLVIQLHDLPAAQTPAPCDRVVQLIGERGRLRAADRQYQLFDHQGSLLDEAHDQAAAPFTFADAVAHHWRQLIDRPAQADPPRRHRARHEAAALACCLACLLSARTRAPESPAKLLAVNGWT